MMRDTQAFSTWRGQGWIQRVLITMHTPAFPVFTVGSTVTLSDYVEAVDYAGNRLAVCAAGIMAPDGTAVAAGLPGDTDITLDQTGSYTVSLYAVDDGNRKTSCSIQLLVNR